VGLVVAAMAGCQPHPHVGPGPSLERDRERELAPYGLHFTGIEACDDLLIYYVRCQPQLERYKREHDPKGWEQDQRDKREHPGRRTNGLRSGPQDADPELRRQIAQQCGAEKSALHKALSPICVPFPP
jgi:hypothetical protein